VIATIIEPPIGLIVGLSLAGAFLIGGVIGLVFFLRWRKRRGLVIELKEPDYNRVAFQNDLELQYKITCKDNYKYVYFNNFNFLSFFFL
jgi:hypothetical protein